MLLCLHAHLLRLVWSILKETYMQRPSRSSAAEWTWHLTSGPHKTRRRAESSCSKSIPEPWDSQWESQSHLFDLPFVVLEHKILLYSEKKCLSFKEQQREHRAREIIGWEPEKLYVVKWAEPLESWRLQQERGCFLWVRWGNWLWAEVGLVWLKTILPSAVLRIDKGNVGCRWEVIRRASWYRWEMAMSSIRLMVRQMQEVVKFWVYFEDGQDLLMSLAVGCYIMSEVKLTPRLWGNWKMNFFGLGVYTPLLVCSSFP